jgi:hypothetical protein
MKPTCYFVFSQSGTSELKILLDSLLKLTTTRNCHLTNSVTAFISLISTLHRHHGKHRLHCCWRCRLCRIVFTEPLLRNGLYNAVVPPLLETDDIKNTASSIVACWAVFKELFPGNAIIKSVTIIKIYCSNMSGFIFQGAPGQWKYGGPHQ